MIHTIAFFVLTAAPLEYSKLIRLKSLADAKKALAGGTSANTKGGEGRTWIMYAAEANKADLVLLLLENGADINAANDIGYTALSFAAHYADAKMVKLLIDKGARPSPAELSDKQTPLHRLMALEGAAKLDVIAALVAGGADVNARNTREETPLHLGAALGDVGRIRFLVEHGAKVDAADKFGYQPLHLAALSRRIPAIKALVELGAKVDARERAGETPFLRLLGSQYDGDDIFATARVLIELGADKNAQDNEGASALHQAVIRHSKKWSDLLIAMGVDSGLRTKKGVSALDQAIINRDAPMVRALAPACKTELDALDKYGATYLHSVVINERADMLKVLIEVGADLNVKNKWGKTPLGAAQQAHLDDMIRILEAAGAQP